MQEKFRAKGNKFCFDFVDLEKAFVRVVSRACLKTLVDTA